MSREQPKGPFCQSCGMPMERAADFGSEKTGLKNNDYCHYCFVDGAFVNPRMSMPEMIDFCVETMAQRRVMPEAEARTLMNTVIPMLKRWRKPAPAAV